MRILGVIPARYGSTRFPGKPLARLAGRPLLAHVVDRARESRRLTRLLVATDDERIAAAAAEAGAEAVLTASGLPSGTDRAAAALRALGDPVPFDVVVNLQGDEPFLPGSAIDRSLDLLAADPEASMATLAVPLDPAEAPSPHAVKVVLDAGGRALYFSRAAIPYGMDGKAARLRHVGLYAFRRTYLERFVDLGPSPLERAEGLEQLRALEDGARIVVAIGDWPVLGVDTPEDLARAERRLAARAAE